MLPADTVFRPAKVTRRRSGRALDRRLDGYRIHHGVVTGDRPWIELDDDGGIGVDGSRLEGDWGTTLHGLFECDGLRAAFLGVVADRAGRRWKPSGLRFADLRWAEADRVADAIEARLDVDRLLAIIGGDR